MNKKKICLVTNWYPTKENPYAGVFFKEQAFATSDYFDYIVVHCKEHKKILATKWLIKKVMGKTITVDKVSGEINTTEYNINIYSTIYLQMLNIIYGIYKKYFKKNLINGVGEYTWPVYERIRKKAIQKAFSKLSEDFDVLYCVDAQSEASVLQYISELKNVPYIVSEHAPFPWPGSVIKDIEHRAIENADLFLAISYDKIRQVMLQNVKLKDIAYVGNMVDDNQFKLAENNNSVKTFIIVAANSFYKNYDLFIEIFNKLASKTYIPFKVMVVGYAANKGYSKGPEILEQKMMASDFAGSVELIPEVAHSEIHNVFAKADAFVMTSIQEGQPVSAMEAGCCGLPIFSTMCGGVEDYVTEDIGRIYGIVDSDAFSDGLKDYLEGKIAFDNQNIRKIIIEKYGKKAFVDNFVKSINSVLGEK